MWIEMGLVLLPNVLVSASYISSLKPHRHLNPLHTTHPSIRLLCLRCAVILLSTAQGFICSLVTRRNVGWSNTLNKPPLNPPNQVFPVVWPALYLLMGIASYRVYTTSTGMLRLTSSSERQNALIVYFVQLFVNWMWSFIYFGCHSLLGAVLDSYLLTVLIGITMRYFFAIDSVAGWLLVPYIVWSCYAAYLSTGIWLLNKDGSGGSRKGGKVR